MYQPSVNLTSRRTLASSSNFPTNVSLFLLAIDCLPSVTVVSKVTPTPPSIEPQDHHRESLSVPLRAYTWDKSHNGPIYRDLLGRIALHCNASCQARLVD